LIKSNLHTLYSIREKHRITDYLDSKGIQSVRSYGDKFSYLCPIHKDSQPSFIVYLPQREDEYENYFCFGCKQSGCIISLYSKIEEVSWREAIVALSDDLEITETSEIDYLVKIIRNQIGDEDPNDVSEIGRLSLSLSFIGYMHAKYTNDDIEEVKFLENFYRKIDEIIEKESLEDIQKLYRYVMDKIVCKEDGEDLTPFMYRYRQWEKRKRDKTLECINAYERIK